MIEENKCKNCPFATIWSGSYGGGGEYPACIHPKAGPRAVNLLDEMDRCPSE